MNISDNAFMLIDFIEKAGFEAYAVGGCVRDSLMGKLCSDIDITTSANPYEVEHIMKINNIKYVETGLKHGTITAVIGNQLFEITTYRTDGEYNDNRHPENVVFVKDIREDLSRRDFTINAMAYNKSNGLVDMFAGKADLDNRLIRAVGDADKRFNEDALRIMRAIRFASVLGFDIENNTKEAIFSNKELLKNVSAERLFSELSKLLLGKNVFSVLTEYREVLAVIIPELIPCFDCEQNNPWHIYDVWEHTCKSVEACPYDLKLRLTMLLHDLGKPSSKTTDENNINHFKGHQAISWELASDVLRRFKVSNEIYNFAKVLIPIHDVTIGTDRKNIRKWLSRLGQDCNGEYYLRYLIEVRRADRLAQNMQKTSDELSRLDFILDEIDSIIDENDALTVSDLAVNGNDLIALGIKGKEIGATLAVILEKVISEELVNEKDIIMKYIKINKL